MYNILTNFNRNEDKMASGSFSAVHAQQVAPNINPRRQAIHECLQELKRLDLAEEQLALAEPITHLQKLNTDEIKLQWTEGSEQDLNEINKLRMTLTNFHQLTLKEPKKYRTEFMFSIEAVLVALTRFWPTHLAYKDRHFQSYAHYEDITDQNRILTIAGLQLTCNEVKSLVNAGTLTHPIPGFKYSKRDLKYILRQAAEHKINFTSKNNSAAASEAFVHNFMFYFIMVAMPGIAARISLGMIKDTVIIPSKPSLINLAYCIAATGLLLAYVRGNAARKKELAREPQFQSEENPRIDSLLSTIVKKTQTTPESRLSSSHNVIANLLPRIASQSNTMTTDDKNHNDLLEINKKKKTVTLPIINRAAILAEVQIRKRR